MFNIDIMNNILVIRNADFSESAIEKVEFLSDDVVTIMFAQSGLTTIKSGVDNVYYTTDGSTPTVSSTKYTEPFTVTVDTEVKAASIDSVGRKSWVASSTFTGEATHDEDGYIAKGMVLHLDGSDFDGTQWLDRVSDMPFVIGDGTPTQSAGGGVYFNGSASMYSDSVIDNPYNSGTIEVVLKAANASNNMVVFFQGANNKLAYILNVNSVAFTTATSNRPTKAIGDVTKLYTHSISSSVNYFNGNSMGASGNVKWQNQATHNMVIGDYWYNTSSHGYKYYGYIYQIRVYNRVLTEDEVLHNASVDIEKYGISV